MAKYKVEAELDLAVREFKARARAAAKRVREIETALKETRAKGQAAMSAVSGAFTRFGSILRGSSSGIHRVVAGLVAVGGAYIGVRAVSNVFRDIAVYAGQANSNVENLTLSLGTVMAEIEGISFGRAQQEATGLYRRIQDIAIESPGTAREVADVFTMAYGPMRRAGAAMDDILRLSQNTLSVAAAMRIDIPQVSRDISMMATGVAGTDVKTFRLLRSMGLITESAREWNEAALRDPTQAANRLMTIFEQLGGPAAEAFGRTWTGVTSAFSDIVENFMRIFGGPAFEATRDTLRAVNDFLLRYRSNLENVMSFIGTSIGNVFGDIFGNLERIFTDTIGQLDVYAARIDELVDRFRELLPTIIAIGKGIAAVTIVTRILAPMMAGIGGLLSLISGLGGFAGIFGVGTTAAGAAGAAAGAGGAAGTAGIAAAGGVGAGFVAILSSAATALGWIVPIIMAIGTTITAVGAIVWATFRRMGSQIWAAMEPIFNDLSGAASDFWSLLVAAWEFVEPFLVVIGTIIASLVLPALAAMSGTLRGLGRTARIVAGLLSRAADVVVPPLHAFALRVMQATRSLVNFISNLFRMIAEIASRFGFDLPSWDLEALAVEQEPGAAENLLARLTEVFGARGAEAAELLRGQRPPPQRPTTNVDMRGSTINVRQEFREADPDRIWMQFVDGMSREAIVRTQSGFVSPLTR